MAHPLLGCIADDFTGATDLANNLVRAGMRTVQTIGVPNSDERLNTDAIVVALKSRTIAPHEAVALSLQAYEWLKSQGVTQIYFKYCSTFDSTPQGNIGPVTEALMDAIYGKGQGFTIACPAFPTNQRTIFKGHLFVGDVLLSESGMRDHPLTPMKDANLVRVLQAQVQRKVGLIDHAVVSQGAPAIRERAKALQAQGVGIAIVDALCEQDLLNLGQALADLALVTAGSGVAIGLPANWIRSGQLSNAAPTDTLPAAKGYQAIISGSCSIASNEQVQHWRAAGHAALAIDPLKLAQGQHSVEQCVQWAQAHLQTGPVLVYATAAPEAVKQVQALLGVSQAGELIEHTLAAIAKALVQAGVRQLVVAGGETSGAVVQALGIERMIIGPQIDPGVPWTAVNSPVCEGDTVHVTLKSGNFGTPDFFEKSFTYLQACTS